MIFHLQPDPTIRHQSCLSISEVLQISAGHKPSPSCYAGAKQREVGTKRVIKHPRNVAHTKKKSSHCRTQIESDNSLKGALSHCRALHY